jgi:acetylornithine deacetylase
MIKRAPSLRDMIKGLIETPSVSSVNPTFDMGNLAVIELLADWLEQLGFEVELQPLAGHNNKANLIARLGQGGEGLILAGHTDTVPYDEGKWRHDPFALTEEAGRLYGLGTCDMKAFLALAIEAARTYVNQPLQRPLVLLATADEESSMDGARLLAEEGQRLGRYCLIGEPTGMRPVRQHKGIMMEAVRLHGRSGHSSDPALGNSALEGMQEVMGAILELRAELQARYRNPAFGVPYPTLNLGHIHGGDNPNRICGECELQYDLRPLPGMDLQELRRTIEQRVERIAERRGLGVECVPLFQGVPAMETPAASLIVRVCEQLTGKAAGAVAFGTEGPYLNSMGIETVVLGPGDIDQAHQPDEFLALSRIEPTLTILDELIRRFCLEQSPVAGPLA